MDMDDDASEESDIEAKIDADLNMDNIVIKSLAKKTEQKISFTKLDSSRIGQSGAAKPMGKSLLGISQRRPSPGKSTLG